MHTSNLLQFVFVFIRLAERRLPAQLGEREREQLGEGEGQRELGKHRRPLWCTSRADKNMTGRYRWGTQGLLCLGEIRVALVGMQRHESVKEQCGEGQRQCWLKVLTFGTVEETFRINCYQYESVNTGEKTFIVNRQAALTCYQQQNNFIIWCLCMLM